MDGYETALLRIDSGAGAVIVSPESQPDRQALLGFPGIQGIGGMRRRK